MKQAASHLTVAASTLMPLSRLLDTLPDISLELKARFAALNANADRVPVSEARQLVEAAVQLTGDADLGLHAARFVLPSDFEVLGWAATSAATWRDACETVCRYVRILDEAAHCRVAVCADKAHVILGCSVPRPRAIVDFQLASFHLAIQRWAPETWPELSVWMKHDRPSDIGAYRAVFPQCQLVFRAAFDGFVYDACRLDTPLLSADPERHVAMAAHAERQLEIIRPSSRVVARVSRDILDSMIQGRVSAERTAAGLHMARRTLVRILNAHGTSYSELLKEVRYRTAMHYLQNTNRTVADIAFLLGYSECPPFVRAFKRWNGHAPTEYRRAHATASATAANHARGRTLKTKRHTNVGVQRRRGPRSRPNIRTRSL
jgi:AraC-like DNA-binding protein